MDKQQELIYLLTQLEAETVPAFGHTDQGAIVMSWRKARQLALDLGTEIQFYKKADDNSDRLLENIHEGFNKIRKIINSVDIKQ